MENSLVKIPKCDISKNKLEFDPSLTFNEWKEAGRFLKQVEGSVQFWVGDWLNFGKKKYEHGKYEQALIDLGYEYHTLTKFSAIAENVEGCRRRQDLGFSHHAEVAPLPPEEQSQWLEKAEQEQLSVRELRTQIKEAKKQDPIPIPDGTYRVIYADPPWSYGDKLIEGYGAAEHHYSSMSIRELCELPFPKTEENAVLFLWVTSPLLKECFEVIEAWGFTYKASFVWDKIKHNYGHYNSVRHELLLICTKGSCLPEIKDLYDSVVVIDRPETHSEKPEHFRIIIDNLYPTGNRIELFARKNTDGWNSWGDEI